VGFQTQTLDPVQSEDFKKGISRVDIAFLALHGFGGEDGSIQQELERRGIPFVGSDSKASRRAFDKLLAKQRFEAKEIPTPSYTVIRKVGWERQLSTFRPPYFMKPVREGSSIGAINTSIMQGEAYYRCGGSKLFFILKVLHRAVSTPYIVSGLGLIWGYLSALIRKKQLLVTDAEASYYKDILIKRLREIGKSLLKID